MMPFTDLFTEQDTGILDWYKTYEPVAEKLLFRQLPPQKVKTVFYGDSITNGFQIQEFFPGCSFMNRGISGDNLAGLYFRLDEDLFPFEPEQVVLMAGINGIQEDNDRMMANMKRSEMPSPPGGSKFTSVPSCLCVTAIPGTVFSIRGRSLRSTPGSKSLPNASMPGILITIPPCWILPENWQKPTPDRTVPTSLSPDTALWQRFCRQKWRCTEKISFYFLKIFRMAGSIFRYICSTAPSQGWMPSTEFSPSVPVRPQPRR